MFRLAQIEGRIEVNEAVSNEYIWNGEYVTPHVEIRRTVRKYFRDLLDVVFRPGRDAVRLTIECGVPPAIPGLCSRRSRGQEAGAGADHATQAPEGSPRRRGRAEARLANRLKLDGVEDSWAALKSRWIACRVSVALHCSNLVTDQNSNITAPTSRGAVMQLTLWCCLKAPVAGHPSQ
jgi:hypothetical protein